MTKFNPEDRPTPAQVAEKICALTFASQNEPVFQNEMRASQIAMQSFAELSFYEPAGRTKALDVLSENKLDDTALSNILLMHQTKPLSRSEARDVLSRLSSAYPFDKSGLIDKFVIMVATLGEIAPAAARAYAVGIQKEGK